MNGVVIVGDGPTAARLTRRLRRLGHDGPLTVVGRSAWPAGHRDAGPGHPAGTRVLANTPVTGLDRARRLVHTAGPAIGYDALVLATGGRPLVPPLPGFTGACGRPGDGVLAPRTAEDSERAAPGRAVVLGGGVLGVETALALRRAGRHVTVVHRAAHPMHHQLDEVAGALVARHLAERDVELLTGRAPAEFTPGKLTLDDGQVLDADALLLCEGIVPETSLARAAQLAVRRGILVDDRLATDDPAVHALGDCAEPPGPWPAPDQADALAALLTGRRPAFPPGVLRPRAPGLDLAVLGTRAALDDAPETVTFTDPARGRYARLALRDGRPAAAVLLGLPHGIAALTQLHDRGLPVPADRLAMLLGTPPRRGAPGAELPDDAVLCRCNNVTKGALARAFGTGARDVAALAAATRATTGCGGCAADIGRLCRTLGEEAE
ncbi:FAD-dependent oxidoreductase [Streptomyces litchfieldiae]|uniref:FAD-dependent oxidoreductase n=1 Tax=Streptomyces litchfieldiae TaxID=3075543 RepID=A0ABU2MVY4_9ACTN|nr:FAD-dependent oxidoreductase [Streptomyces sp. DSM 44938]MDT0345797.1 FAD-dependent oxidoreductase [Streptomyces sp. DSM 44938]